MVKRGREKDEYPEFIRETVTMPVVTTTANTCSASSLVLQDWVLPVELDLNQPTFIELNKLVVWLDTVTSHVQIASASAVGGELALSRVVKVFILNERRTAIPLGDDNAIIMQAELTLVQSWASTTSSAANCAVLDKSKTERRAVRKYEDKKTGMGLLVAQPRIFLMCAEIMTEGALDLGVHTASQVNFKMEFRLTDQVSSKEFFTEMIAKFS